jgi:hypothetical protein
LGCTAAIDAATYALPTLISGGVLAAPGRPGANDRTFIGYIGVSGMAIGQVCVDDSVIRAICDVDDNYIAHNIKKLT